MIPQEASTGEFYLLLGMFILGMVVLAFVSRWYRQWKSPVEGSRMSMEDARDELGRFMSERLALTMRVAEMEHLLQQRWAEWPLAYRPILNQVMRQCQLLEDNLVEESKERGIYPKRIVSDGPLIAPEPQPPSFLPNESVPPQSGNVVAMPTAPGREWINGQLLPAVRTG